jgi:hypothetical protein
VAAKPAPLGLKGATTPSQGRCKSSCYSGILAVSVVNMAYLSGRAAPAACFESFKACYVLIF